MSTLSKIDQFLQTYKNFRDLNPDRIFDPLPSHADFDGPNPEESRETLKYIYSILDGLGPDEPLRSMPWHTFNAIVGVAQNVYVSFAAYQSSRDQGSYQNFAAHLDSFSYHLRMFGFGHLASGQSRIEQTKATLDRELEKLLLSNREIDSLKSEVRALIAPAVAGSLSEAFTSRRNALLKGRITWAVVTAIGGVSSIFFTFDFISAVSDAFLDAAQRPSSDVWQIAIIRSAILVPVYAAFGFAFSQYKKERDFEEEYAHKAAVATSLPNYGDLAREPAVRDQIVTGATNVIFSSPTARSREIEKSGSTVSSLRELVESIGRLGGKKE